MSSANSTVDVCVHADNGLELNLTLETLNAGDLIASRYRLRETLGTGGMGTVWLAEQLVPITRLVAIKFLRSDVSSPRIIARFAREHQALALMNHPNVAQVYDGGETESHVPFLVMEFVKGSSITEYCDRARLSIRDRLKLLVKVCAGVEHAHQRGIIHRDLKPNNVLVSDGVDGPNPKVIDFGLAKKLPWSEFEPASVAATIPGFVVGTPSYMAPEQVSARDAEIDTRTDVYALGILLFELIAGEVPFGQSQHAPMSWLDTFQQILHAEPPRPSRCVDKSENRTEIARTRSTTANELSRSLRSELDWIVLKAIEKSPELRYDSVGSFKRDLQRVIDDQPVEAHPPSLRYQLSKFARQHFLFTVSCLTMTVAISAGFVGMRRGQILARAAEQESRLALAAEKSANDRSRLAIAALSDALSSASFSEADSEQALLTQVIALHDLSEPVSHPHEFQQLHERNGKQDLNGRIKNLQAMAALLRRMDDDHHNPAYRSVMANVQYHLARLLARSGNPSAAEAEYRASLGELERLSNASNPSPMYKQRMATICDALAELLLASERQAESQALQSRANELRRLRAYPKSPL